MRESESGIVKNRLKTRSVVTVAVIYMYALSMLSAMTTEHRSLLFAFVVYVLVTIVVARAILLRELALVGSQINKFKKNFPFSAYGAVFGEFQHVFFSQQSIVDSLEKVTGQGLSERTPAGPLTSLSLADIDKDILSVDARPFLRSDAGSTVRGTTITLLMHTALHGKMHCVRWWVMGRGYVDRNRYFFALARAPLTLPFWIVPYFKRDVDVVSHLRTIYPGFYNDVDVVRIARCLHETVFDSLVAALEHYGIDTSDLKTQRAQVMNINVSGGKLEIGNVVQGAANRISSMVQKAKAA